MLKYFINKIHNKKQSSNILGFSLVELVVAMSILMIIMPATVGIMKAATSYKNQALQSNQNLVHSSAFNTVFRGDIENAVGINIVDNNHIKLKIAKKSSGSEPVYVCKDWVKNTDGLLKSKVSSPPVKIVKPSSSTTEWKNNWSNIFDGSITKAGKSGKIFVYENGSVTYDIKLGDKNMVTDYTGTITPNSTPVSSAPCW